MLSKEEMHKVLNKCDNCNLKECINCEMSYTVRQMIREYIEQLEKEVEEVTIQRNELATILSDKEDDKQKLMEKLEKDNEQDTESVKRFEEMRRNCQADSFYKKSYQTSIHKLNARRSLRSNILEILKGEKE